MKKLTKYQREAIERYGKAWLAYLDSDLPYVRDALEACSRFQACLEMVRLRSYNSIFKEGDLEKYSIHVFDNNINELFKITLD